MTYDAEFDSAVRKARETKTLEIGSLRRKVYDVSSIPGSTRTARYGQSRG